jgi:hypothetical protein
LGLTWDFSAMAGVAFWLCQGERDRGAEESEGFALGAGRLGEYRDGDLGSGEADLVAAVALRPGIKPMSWKPSGNPPVPLARSGGVKAREYRMARSSTVGTAVFAVIFTGLGVMEIIVGAMGWAPSGVSYAAGAGRPRARMVGRYEPAQGDLG